MRAKVAAISLILCFACMCGLFVWQSFNLRAEKERADAAEKQVETLNFGLELLALVAKQVSKDLKENCADAMAVCQYEAVAELPCYPNCTLEEKGANPDDRPGGGVRRGIEPRN
jgi:hypothetical protein